MKIIVDMADLMDELDLEALGLTLDPPPVTAGQVLAELTDRGVLTVAPRRKSRRPLRLAVRTALAAALVLALGRWQLHRLFRLGLWGQRAGKPGE